VTIKSDYVGIKIGLAPTYHFKFDLKLDYGTLNNDLELNFTKKNVDGSDKIYSGYYGNQSTSNNINITSDYGSVTFYKN
jgi:hypothetical protein